MRKAGSPGSPRIPSASGDGSQSVNDIRVKRTHIGIKITYEDFRWLPREHRHRRSAASGGNTVAVGLDFDSLPALREFLDILKGIEGVSWQHLTASVMATSATPPSSRAASP